MNPGEWFFNAHLSAIYIFTFALVLAALGAGVLLGRRFAHRHRGLKDSSVGTAVAATLGLLAFLLAFTFNMTAERFSERKALLLDEVHAISTGYLRADFLPVESADRAKKLLSEYAAVRDFVPGNNADYATIFMHSEKIHAELWRIVSEQVGEQYNADYLRQFVDPLNRLIDFHHSRVTVGLGYRIPGPIWSALYFITVLAMLVIGFQFGISSGGSLQVASALALTFATVILLISDLDRANEGVLVVDQTPMSELAERLRGEERQRLGGS